MTDPISDMLTRIRNAVSAKHTRVDMPASKLKAEIARILQDEGYIQGFRMSEEPAERAGRQPRQVIRVFLKYGPHGEKVISGYNASAAWIWEISRGLAALLCLVGVAAVYWELVR